MLTDAVHVLLQVPICSVLGGGLEQAGGSRPRLRGGKGLEAGGPRRLRCRCGGGVSHDTLFPSSCCQLGALRLGCSAGRDCKGPRRSSLDFGRPDRWGHSNGPWTPVLGCSGGHACLRRQAHVVTWYSGGGCPVGRQPDNPPLLSRQVTLAAPWRRQPVRPHMPCHRSSPTCRG